MDWFEAVDVYCERTGPGFWSEPINAWTNVAFIVAGFVVLWARRKSSLGSTGVIAALPWLLMLVGAFSFAFHTFANRLTGLLDVLGIAIFVVAYITAYFPVVAAWSRVRVAGLVLAVLALSVIIPATASRLVDLPGPILSTLSYLPAWLATVLAALTAARRQSPATVFLTLAAGLFILSAAARSLDAWSCNFTPFGTHFLWHLLNGVVLMLTCLGLDKHRLARAISAPPPASPSSLDTDSASLSP